MSSRPRLAAVRLFLWRLAHPKTALRVLLPQVLSAQARARLFAALGRFRKPRAGSTIDAERFAHELSDYTSPAPPPRSDGRVVSILIVTYNNLQLTRLCIDSLLRFTSGPFELVVVDNASTDGVAKWLTERGASDARIRVTLNDENRGFAAAANQAAANARGDVLLFLNNDVVVPPEWLEPLLDALALPDAGIVGATTNAVGNEARVDAGYSTFAEFTAFAAERRRRHRGRTLELPMLAFFCVAMTREVWQRIGALDERFGIGMFEDDDYARRVRQSGLRVLLALDAYVHHWQRASFRLDSESAYVALYDRNRALFREKWKK